VIGARCQATESGIYIDGRDEWLFTYTDAVILFAAVELFHVQSEAFLSVWASALNHGRQLGIAYWLVIQPRCITQWSRIPIVVKAGNGCVRRYFGSRRNTTILFSSEVYHVFTPLL
jgi:hypothetical protein